MSRDIDALIDTERIAIYSIARGKMRAAGLKLARVSRLLTHAHRPAVCGYHPGWYTLHVDVII